MKIVNPVNLIIEKDEKILLFKRSDKDKEYKSAWSLPGGGCLEQETFEKALKREIKEGLNCNVKWFKYFKSYIMKFENFIARTVYFYGEIDGEIKLNEELSEYKWFDKKEILNLKLAFNQEQVLKDFISDFINK